MKLINFFSSSKKTKKNKSKNNESKSPSFSSSTTSFSSSDVYTSTPKSVLTASRDKRSCKVSRRELEVVLRRILASEDEVEAMLAEVYSRANGSEDDGNVGMEEILALCCDAEMEEAEAAEAVAPASELRETFAVFDTDGDGRISAEELHGVFMVLMGEEGGCSLDDCRRMIGAVDGDGDGFVCFEDFVRMMTEAQR